MLLRILEKAWMATFIGIDRSDNMPKYSYRLSGGHRTLIENDSKNCGTDIVINNVSRSSFCSTKQLPANPTAMMAPSMALLVREPFICTFFYSQTPTTFSDLVHIYPEDGKNALHRNVGTHLPDYMVFRTRKTTI